MDRHPVILQQGIETLAILELREAKVICALHKRQVHGPIHLPGKDKRIEADLITEEIHSDDHRGEANMNEADHGHDRAFPFTGLADEDQAEYPDPDRPKQKTSLLRLPNARKKILQGHRPARMFPGKVVFEKMVRYDIDDGQQYAEDRCNVDVESAPRHPSPTLFFFGLPGSRRPEESVNGDQCSAEEE